MGTVTAAPAGKYVGDVATYRTPMTLHTAGVLATPGCCWPDGEASLWPDEWAVVGIAVARELGWLARPFTHDVWLRVVAALEDLADDERDENDLYSAALLGVLHDAGVASLPGDVLGEVLAHRAQCDTTS